MVEIVIRLPDELKKQAEEANIDLSMLLAELVKRELIKKRLLERLNSKEEQDFIKWSVELGRKAKNGRFERLLSEVSPEVRENLIKATKKAKSSE